MERHRAARSGRSSPGRHPGNEGRVERQGPGWSPGGMGWGPREFGHLSNACHPAQGSHSQERCSPWLGDGHKIRVGIRPKVTVMGGVAFQEQLGAVATRKGETCQVS